MNKDIDTSADHSNSTLIYEYTETYLEDVNKGLDSINQKVTTILGSTGILLRFSADLPSTYLSLKLTKIGICILLVITIVLCLIILIPQKNGDIVDPSELLETEWFYKKDELIRLFIARQWLAASQQLDEKYANKAKHLKYCYWCIGCASALFATNIICSTVFPAG